VWQKQPLNSTADADGSATIWDARPTSAADGGGGGGGDAGHMAAMALRMA